MKNQNRTFDDDNAIFSDFLFKGICCEYSFELHQQVDAIQMSTHNICLYKEVKKKYTGCNLKTTEFLDCALIGVYAVIRSNMIYIFFWLAFVCVEVLRPSQPNGVMLSVVSLPNHTFTGRT